MNQPHGKKSIKRTAVALSIPLLGLASIVPSMASAGDAPSIKDRLANVRTVIAASSEGDSTRDPSVVTHGFNNFREVKKPG